MEQTELEKTAQRYGITNVEGISWSDFMILLQALEKVIDEETMRSCLAGVRTADLPTVFLVLSPEHRALMGKVMPSMRSDHDFWVSRAHEWRGSNCPEIVRIALGIALDRSTRRLDVVGIAVFCDDEEVRLRAHAMLSAYYGEFRIVNLIDMMAKVPVESAPHAQMADVLMSKRLTCQSLDEIVALYGAVWRHTYHEEGLRPEILVRLCDTGTSPAVRSAELVRVVTHVPWQSPLFLESVKMAQDIASGCSQNWFWYNAMRYAVEKRRADIPTSDGAHAVPRGMVDALYVGCVYGMVETAKSRYECVATLRMLNTSGQQDALRTVATRLLAAVT